MSRSKIPRLHRSVSGRRVAWALVDQVLSSGSNALLPLVAIGRLAPANAGRLSVVLSVILLSIGVARGIVGESYVVYASREDDVTTGDLRRRMMGLAVIVGALMGTVLAAFAAIYLHTRVGGILLGIGFLGVIVQDAARFSMFESGHLRAAALNDLVWLSSFAAFALVILQRPSPITLLLAWCGCGAGCAGLALLQLSVRPHPAEATSLLREKLSTSWKVGTEFILTAGVPQLLVAVVAVFGTLESGAAYRLAITLVSPAGVVAGGLAAGLQPVAMRAQNNYELRRVVAATWLVSTIAVIACAGLVFVIPAGTGANLFGESFKAAKPLVAILAAASVALAGCLAVGLAIRSKMLLAPSLVVRSVVGAVTLGASIPIVAAHSALGAAAIFAAGSWVMLAGLIWVISSRTIADQGQDG